jgi:hypothetical protein
MAMIESDWDSLTTAEKRQVMVMAESTPNYGADAGGPPGVVFGGRDSNGNIIPTHLQSKEAIAAAKRETEKNIQNLMQKKAKDAAYAKENQGYAEAQNIAKIKAQASIEQAKIDADTQATLSRIRANQSREIANINARASMLAPQFKQDKFDQINPQILDAINKSKSNYGMYDALGGTRPVDRASLGLTDKLYSSGQIQGMNDSATKSYGSALSRSAAKLADKYQKQGYGSDSPILSGLLDSQSGMARTMGEGTAQKIYDDTLKGNQQYGFDSNKLIETRQGTLADLKTSTDKGNLGLLGLLRS